jgi:hypothetical protein
MVVSFFVGRGFEHLLNGYRYEVRETKEIKVKGGTVIQMSVMEHVGLPFLDTGKTILEYTGRDGMPIQIYKAQRMFQEGYPVARNVRREDSSIAWEDGLNQYKLEITPIPEEKTDQDAGINSVTSLRDSTP